MPLHGDSGRFMSIALPFPEAHLCNHVDYQLCDEDLGVQGCIALFLQSLLHIRVRAGNEILQRLSCSKVPETVQNMIINYC